jgi:hypothetical protein
MSDMNNLFVKLRGKIFVKKPVVQTLEKETRWIRLRKQSSGSGTDNAIQDSDRQKAGLKGERA